MSDACENGSIRIAVNIVKALEKEKETGEFEAAASIVYKNIIASDPGVKALVEFAWEHLGRCHCDKGSSCDACRASDALRFWEFGS